MCNLSSLLSYLVVVFQILVAAGTQVNRRSNNSASFVSVANGKFNINGGPFNFYGTNAYWVQMTTDEDMETTFHDIATAGMQVVRVWAFNDVSQKPASGTYFQILANGVATINTGSDGLQRLDKVVATAAKFGIKLLLTLTNNWNPDRPQPSTSLRRNADGPGVLPRGYLSNDYGGIDLYNRAFVSHPTHDEFYTNPQIISAFKNYISQVVPRYANDPTILGWELGNDIRCASTLPASPQCNTKTITTWVNDIAGHVKQLDSRHLITAGDGGFYCPDCPKIYAPATPKDPNAPSGPSFDGSYGVDTEDILSIPCIDFGTFQLFPDQTQYFVNPKGEFATQAISQGGLWVAAHSATATKIGKPEALTAFAIVTKDHYGVFVPFNSSARTPGLCGGVDTFQQNYAFVSWASVAFSGNVGGALEYQWLQGGLQDVPVVLRKRSLMPSPNDGSAHYQGPYTNQTSAQAGATVPPPS
jgi:mannan endo-1,4-beta-mannosidase